MALKISDLTGGAVKYDGKLKLLAYLLLDERLATENYNLHLVANERKTIYNLRQGNLAKPYAPGVTITDAEVGSFKESILRTENCYAAATDFITNYQDVEFSDNPKAGTGYLANGISPAEKIIRKNMLTTLEENIYYTLWSGVRNIADQSTTGMFDGFDKQITDAIATTEISAANGNYGTIGSIDAPLNANDTDAIDKIIEFVSSASISLVRDPSILRIGHETNRRIKTAMDNKQIHRDNPKTSLEDYINDRLGSQVKVVISYSMGYGDRIVLSAPDVFDVGFDTFSDHQFITASQDNKDKFQINYWAGFKTGVKIATFNKKAFYVSDGTPDHRDESGDYTI